MKTLTKLGSLSAIALTTALLTAPNISSAVIVDPTSPQNITDQDIRNGLAAYGFTELASDAPEFLQINITDSVWAAGQEGDYYITDTSDGIPDPCVITIAGGGCSDVIRKVNTAAGASIFFLSSGISNITSTVPNEFVTDGTTYTFASLPAGAFTRFGNESLPGGFTAKNEETNGTEIVINLQGDDIVGSQGLSDLLTLSVPEPATLVLLATGLLGMGLSRRRQGK